MASINDFGGADPDRLDNPPLGGPDGWAAAVAAALDGDDTTVDTRIADAIAAIPPGGGGGGGGVIVAEGSFTSASSVIVDNCFTPGHADYAIIVEVAGASGSLNVLCRLRADGVDSSTSYDRVIFYTASNGNPTRDAALGAANWFCCSAYAGYFSFVRLDVSSPADPRITFARTSYLDRTASVMTTGLGMFAHTAPTAYDGLHFYTSAGQITGRYRVIAT